MSFARAALFPALVAGSLFAQQPPPSIFGASSIPETPIVQLELQIDEAVGDEVTGKVIATIDPRWHVNSATPKDDFAIPTVLTIESPALDVTKIAFPPHVERAFSFAGGKLPVYEGRIEIVFTAKLKEPKRGDVRATLRYQACDDKICLPPRDASVTGAYPPGRALSSYGQRTADNGQRYTPLDQAPRDAALFSGDIGSTLASRGLLLTLLVVFVLGLALNLTPCVYPLIPITVAYFSSQTEGKKSRQVALSLSYVLGLALTYSALGVFAALSGQLFGAWLQLPAVLIFFAVLMVVLSASMFGLYDIRVPQFIAGRAGARGGIAGATTMGLLAGVVAAPCVGPF
ncbi:MAG TPA: cytochrome c biogenesis protein CcdA, partial [Thermoanaerobaculia bacterium]